MKIENPKKQPKPKTPLPSKVEEVKIDAAGKVLGRLATEIAIILRGKNKPNFRPNVLMGDKVLVSNAGKIVITGNKIEQKEYIHHTGYLGHLKKISLKELMAKNPAEVLRRAVYGMLPKNKLRARWLKNLKITNRGING